MPETAIATPPAETPPAETPKLSGSAALEAQMDSMIQPPKPAETKPADKPADKPAEKPAVATTQKPAPKGKPADKPAESAKADSADKPLDWKTAPAQFRAAHEKLLQVHEQTKKEKETEVGKLQSRLSELDRRKVLTPEQETEYQKKEQRLAALESDLYARDYRESPEFKEKYQNKWKATFTKAISEVVGLNVTRQNKDGEEITAQTTQQDFEEVLDAKTDTSAMGIAENKFGKYAVVALRFRERMAQINDEAEQAIIEKRTGFQTSRQKSMEQFQNDSKTFESKRQEYDQALLTKYPDFFGDDGTNPDITTAIKQGVDFVDSAVNGANNMPLDERAKMTTLVRRWAASWPRDQVVIKNLKSQLSAQDEELKKYRKSVPGNEDDGGTHAETATNKGTGTSGLADAFEKKLRA